MHSNLLFSSNLDRKRELNFDLSKKREFKISKKVNFFITIFLLFFNITDTHSNNISIAIKCVMLLMKEQ